MIGQLWRLLGRRRRLRAFFVGMLVSRTGDFFNVIALSWLALEIAGPEAVGVLFAIGGICGAVTAPLAGWLLDRVGLRRMMVLDNVFRAAIAITIPVMMWTGTLNLAFVFGFAVLSGVTGTVTELGQGIVIPMLVEDDELDLANKLVSVIWEVSTWVGPALAGLTVQFAGMEAALLVDAGTFALMAVVSLAMPAVIDESARRGGVRRHLADGFRMIWTARPYLVSLSAAMCMLILAGVLEVYFPIFTHEVLRTGPAAYGLLVSMVGFGALVGAIWGSEWLGRLRLNLAVGYAFVLRLALLLPLVFLREYWTAVAVLTLGSFVDGALTTVNRSIMQHQVPLHVRGRVFGAARALTAGGFPIGSAGAGLLVAAFSPQVLVLLTVAAFLPMTLLVIRTRLAKENVFGPPPAKEAAPA